MFQAAQQEALVANGDAGRLERDLAHARTAALANGMGVKSRLQALQFELRIRSVLTLPRHVLTIALPS
jgi:kinetochore protein NDC80